MGGPMRHARLGCFVEPLEGRRLLTVSTFGTTVVIDGTEGPDFFQIFREGSTVWIQDNATWHAFPAGNVTRLQVYAWGGDDKLVVRYRPPDTVYYSGGTGTDRLQVADDPRNTLQERVWVSSSQTAILTGGAEIRSMNYDTIEAVELGIGAFGNDELDINSSVPVFLSPGGPNENRQIKLNRLVIQEGTLTVMEGPGRLG